MKLCECGCGEPAPIARQTRPQIGHVKGRPIRFIKGHYRRITLEPPNPSGLCLCGCGQRTQLAPQTRKRSGHVQGQPMKYILGHNNRGREIKAERWVEEDRGYETPCHIWRLAKWASGYGKVKIDRRQYHAHRAAFEAAFGPVDRSLEIDHMCRQCDCVRLDHLRVVTHQQNAQNVSPRIGTSSYRGVSWVSACRRWQARVQVGGKGFYLGLFVEEGEAARAALEARRRLMPFAVD
jgi:hypothetical protein